MTTVRTSDPRTPAEQRAHLQLLLDDATAKLGVLDAKCNLNPSLWAQAKIDDAKARVAAAQAELEAHDKEAA